jgi:phospholipid/cholesterol/gamma-HCH transport system substrate-binding protein
MDRNKISSEIKVGILVILAIIVFFYMSFRIGKLGVFREGGYEVAATLTNAGGLDPKTPVQIAGIEVGKVRRITLQGMRARVYMSVKDAVKLPVDSKIMVKTQGVLGDKLIEIVPGASLTYMKNGDFFKDVVKVPDYEEMFAQIQKAAKSFGDTMDEFKGVLGDKEKENIKKSIDNIQGASADFRDLLKNNKENITKFVEKLPNVAANADETLTGLKNVVKDIEAGKGTLGKLAKDDALYDDAKATVTSLKNLTSDMEQGKGTLGKLAKDDALYNEAKETMKNVRELTDGIKKGEGTLGKLAKDDSLYVEAEKSMKKLQKAAEGLAEQTPITIMGTILGTFF